MSWVSSTLVFVRDVDAAIGFYVDRLGFMLGMRHEEGGRALVAGVSRGEGSGLLLTCQWPEKVGSGILYAALGAGEFEGFVAELAAKGIETGEGWWGSPLVIVTDPDGNQLYFPRPE
ncbi:VOC family protein [Sphingomonas sp.]|uniref:VOC family protein n=1 Tax=Sphingomonas sp. TaxID=28214 RepID=UPI001B0D95BE|nr:VOC family protein [Sphingomonas sp.]MBO9714051.1 hypothetical protein [Sphingomonas sp.]